MTYSDTQRNVSFRSAVLLIATNVLRNAMMSKEKVATYLYL